MEFLISDNTDIAITGHFQSGQGLRRCGTRVQIIALYAGNCRRDEEC